ncbi:UPF0182 family protein [Micrococcus terreus]|uniref:UPF0182 family membrane protein n=1 Tax=Micrococcus terreus TaxID=574650 RepID=UPI00254FC541|nr:UPF0182 family protein [Micrococcus terreus]MDK7701170.1 UPF0182 family protein [Micrococcus terreus]WOO98657.1 UPF0182 family protein [Micrococcus terreus]
MLTIIIVAALVALFVLFSGVYTEILWFNQIGYSEVFWTEHITRAVLFVIGALVMGGATWAAMWLAWRSRPKNLGDRTRDTLAQYQQQLEPIRRLVFIGVPALLAFFAGSAAMSAWQDVLLFLNQVPYGKVDPEFGMDFSFYMATLPMLGILVGYLISVVLIAGIAGLLVHYLYGSIRVEERGGITVEKGARIHLGVFAALFLILQGANYWLDRYRTLQSQSGQWAGALYTDVHAVIPTSTILAVAAVLVAILFVVTIITGRWRISLIGTVVLIIGAIVAGGAYPFAIQEWQVKPSEQTREAEYIKRNIELTREAYGLNEIENTQYAGETEAEEGGLTGESTNTANIRLMDPNLLSRTFGQLQQFRPYYGFPNTLHVDRYEVDGETKDTIIAAREVNVDRESSWVNQHIIYTHGYGMVAADASEVSAGGRPSFLLSGIPSRGDLGSDADYEPRIYFGMNSPQYSVVGAPDNAPERERDRPQDADSTEDTTYTFSGDGGPSVGNLFNKLVYAIKFGSTELLLSTDINSESQILYDRNPVQRVEKVAPYLTVDSNSYPAIVDGRIQWIVDAYTTSDAFPYSKQEQLDSATRDALNTDVAANLSGRVNYIRNSVKATVDAYSGEVTLYAWEEDPLLQAWQKVYPSTLRPYSEMTAELMDHVRYPEDMFKVQRELLGRYHVTNPGDFYENNDAWSVPADPTQGNADVKQPPYYMSLQMPGKDEPAFSLTTTFIPQLREAGTQRNVLYGFLSANGDAGTGKDGEKAESYGHLQLLELPRSTAVPGPGQAQANFDSNDQVSRELNLLRQGASDVINGNMITLPVANGILYVQPVYVQSTGSTSYPTLRKVLVSFGDRVGFGDTLQESLDQVFGGDAGVETGETPAPPSDGEPGSEPTPPLAQSDQERLSQALADAQSAIEASETAMASGDWAAYGEAQSQLNDALSRATEADDAIREAMGAPDPAAEDSAEGEAPTEEAAPEAEGTDG